MAGRRKAPGTIERAQSGRYRAYYTHQMARHTPGRLFTTRAAAEAWLNAERALIDRDDWTPPAERRAADARAEALDSTTLDAIANEWIDRRTTSRGTPLAARTMAEYRSYLTGRLADLAARPIAQVDRSLVDRWWQDNQDAPLLRHHAYAFLKSVMADAVERELIASNPCRVPNAARRSTQRPKALQNELITGLSALDVATLADGTRPAQWSALVLLLAYSGLRPNEAFALTRRDITMAAADDGTPQWTVRVTGSSTLRWG